MDRSRDQISDRVRWCVIEDAVFVLDIESGEYFALNPEMTQNWLRLAQGKPVDAEALQEIRAHGWLEPKRPARVLKPRPLIRFTWIWPSLDALVTIAMTRTRLKLFGFAHAYRSAEMLCEPTEPRHHAPDEITDDLASFLRAEGLLPSRLGNDDCLPRSLSLYSFLKRRGHNVEHVIGIGRFPFDAHAWVTLDGEPLLEFSAEQKALPGAIAPRGRTAIATLA